MLRINSHINLPLCEIELSTMRAQGPGGQNVNKVSSAIHLRFDITASSLPDTAKSKLLALNDSRITKGGIIVIKANEHRQQARNKDAALSRLKTLIREAIFVPRRRIATRPSRGAVKRRLEAKANRSQIKSNRKKPLLD